MMKGKIKLGLLVIAICSVIGIAFVYLYYDGYIASDINTGDCITYAVKEILLSENSSEEKQQMIEEICFYSNSEIIVKNISNNTIICKKESEFKNKKIFNDFPLTGQIINTKYGKYSIEYKTYVPKFYSAITSCINLGKNIIRI